MPTECRAVGFFGHPIRRQVPHVGSTWVILELSTSTLSCFGKMVDGPGTEHSPWPEGSGVTPKLTGPKLGPGLKCCQSYDQMRPDAEHVNS